MLQCLNRIFHLRPDNKHVTILVIDDSEVDQKIVGSAVRRGGYSLLTAYDGTSGIALAHQHKPNLIVLDYNLPDIQGPEVCKLLKNEEDTRKIPVLFLTSLTSPGSIIDCYEQGAENYLAKPIKPKFFLKQIDQALKDHKDQE